MWAVLASVAAEAHELNTAEIAYAAINAVCSGTRAASAVLQSASCSRHSPLPSHNHQIDKVEHIQRIKVIPTPEGRRAAIALFCRQVRNFLLKAHSTTCICLD